MQDTILDLSIVDHDDHQHAILGQGQEFDLPQQHLRGSRHRDDASHARELRQHAGHRADKRGRVLEFAAELQYSQ